MTCAMAFLLAPATVWQASHVHYRPAAYPYDEIDRTKSVKIDLSHSIRSNQSLSQHKESDHESSKRD
jgi:hypothetical protein